MQVLILEAEEWEHAADFAEPMIREEPEIVRCGRTDRTKSRALCPPITRCCIAPNGIVTPHIAYDTEEALRRFLDTTVGNIADRPPRATGYA